MPRDYITPIATFLLSKFNKSQLPQSGVDVLFKYYTLLLLTKGEATTSKDVHDCWSLWAIDYDPTNRSLVPFSELDTKTQMLDDIFAQTIRDSSTIFK